MPNSLLTATHRSTAKWAAGLTIADDNGVEYLDACSGAVVSTLGHSNNQIVEAISDQLQTLDYAHRGQFHHQLVLGLAERLTQLTGLSGGSCYFFCSGSEAVEAAMKIAYAYQYLTQGPQGTVASRSASYHGATIETLRLTGHRGKRGIYDPFLARQASLPPITRANSPHQESARHRESALGFDKALHDAVDHPAALLLETIPGAAGGAVMPANSYYASVRDYCDDTGSLWIADEVMTGMGRTGTWFAYQHWNSLPDIVCIGKGLGAGYWPISAIVVQAHVATAVLDAAATPVGHTYSNHPAGAAAAHAVIDTIQDNELLHQSRGPAEQLRQGLESIAAQLPEGSVEGVGLFLGLHFTGPPHGPSARQVVEACRSRRLLVYEAPRPDSSSSDAVLVTPPLTSTDQDITEIIHRLRLAVTKL